MAGKKGRFPFPYAARWRDRLRQPFKQNAHLFGVKLRTDYEYGHLQWGASEGAWVRGNEIRAIRAICGQRVDEKKSVIGTAELDFRVVGMSNEKRENFLQLHPFVLGLAGAEMYEKALAFLEGDRSGVLTAEQVRVTVTGWGAAAS